MPAFWLGMMGILLFATKLHLLPTQGMYNLRAGYKGFAYVLDVMEHMILPCSALIAIQIPSYFRITKTSSFAGHGGRLYHDLPRDGHERKEDLS